MDLDGSAVVLTKYSHREGCWNIVLNICNPPLCFIDFADDVDWTDRTGTFKGDVRRCSRENRWNHKGVLSVHVGAGLCEGLLRNKNWWVSDKSKAVALQMLWNKLRWFANIWSDISAWIFAINPCLVLN